MSGVTSSGGRPVDLRTRFERFPATVKGAFVLQGADGNPHAVRFESVRLARIPTGPARPLPLDEIVVDVAPARNLFVPFEASVSDLDPGWYVIRTQIKVDAGTLWTYSSRAFTVAWPRSEIRRGTLRVGRTVKVGGRGLSIERVELGSESSTVVWRPERRSAPGHAEPDDGAEPEVILLADGVPLVRIPPEALPPPPKSLSAADRRTVAYPVPRSAGSASIVVRLPSGEESESLQLHLD
jgi:hypothetical protein